MIPANYKVPYLKDYTVESYREVFSKCCSWSLIDIDDALGMLCEGNFLVVPDSLSHWSEEELEREDCKYSLQAEEIYNAINKDIRAGKWPTNMYIMRRGEIDSMRIGDLLEWGIDRFPFPKPLQEALSIFQLANFKMTKSEKNEIEFLSVAQTTWWFYPELNKTEIANHPFIKKYNPHSSYYNNSGQSGEVFKKLSKIDPVGEKRKRGRPSKSFVDNKKIASCFREIPGVYLQENGVEKLNLQKAVIVYRVISRMVADLESDSKLNSWLSPLIPYFFSRRIHPLIQDILFS
ncbi:MAG: hypothetical protein Q8L98_08355 [Chlamydiales bacterium]|nr:hypothetical protein [Chlamydiales bacterium]